MRLPLLLVGVVSVIASLPLPPQSLSHFRGGCALCVREERARTQAQGACCRAEHSAKKCKKSTTFDMVTCTSSPSFSLRPFVADLFVTHATGFAMQHRTLSLTCVLPILLGIMAVSIAAQGISLRSGPLTTHVPTAPFAKIPKLDYEQSVDGSRLAAAAAASDDQPPSEIVLKGRDESDASDVHVSLEKRQRESIPTSKPHEPASGVAAMHSPMSDEERSLSAQSIKSPQGGNEFCHFSPGAPPCNSSGGVVPPRHKSQVERSEAQAGIEQRSPVDERHFGADGVNANVDKRSKGTDSTKDEDRKEVGRGCPQYTWATDCPVRPAKTTDSPV